MARKAPTLPRETNPARVRSIYSRSVRKAGEAARRFRLNPNPGTEAARWDRILACIAQRYKVAFVRTYPRTDLHGAAKTSAVRKAARLYRDAMRRWAHKYDDASGWSAARRLTK